MKNGEGLSYKWVIAGLCFLIMFVGLGFCSSAKNVYFQPISEALNFSRSAFGFSDTFRYATTSVVTLFFYKLLNRFGTKKLLCAGLACYALSMLINAVSNTLTGFYIGGLFLGTAVAFAGTAMVSIVINYWFDKNKGTVLGIILAANAAGSATAIALLEPMIYSDGVGYKNAYFVSAVCVVVVLIIVALFYKNKAGYAVSGAGSDKKQKTEQWDGFEYERLTKKPAFYTIIICLMLYTLLSVGNIANPHFKDLGFSGEFIAVNSCIGSIGLAASKILVGILYDRLGLKISVNLCLFTALAAKLLLFFITAETTVLAISYSVLMSIATPLETIMISIIVLDLFGRRCFHKTLALTTSLFTVGQALNTPLLNVPYDFMGNYMISFVVSMVASVIIIVAFNASMISLKADAKNEKPVIEISKTH